MVHLGIPLDKAEFLSLLLEGVFYGFSLLMFGGTTWLLFSRRSLHQVNFKMFMVACSLLVLSTLHFVFHTIWVVEGLILFRDSFRGGPIAFFSDVSHWAFVSKNHIYIIHTLLADGIILYRCYIIWQSKLVMILPVLLWLSTGVTGIAATYTARHVMQNGAFGRQLSMWITAFWASALSTNLLATFMLLSRIWYIGDRAARMRSQRSSHLRLILRILIDAGVIYSLTLFVGLICFLVQSNGQYVVLDMVTPIISITFYMVIIRLGLAFQVNQMTNDTLDVSHSERGLAARSRRGVLVHITTFSDNMPEDSHVSSTRLTPHSIGNKHLSGAGLEDVREVA